MEKPEPVREHRELEKLAGHFSGPERMHSSYFNDTNRKGLATTDARVALDGFAVVQDYAQELDDGSRFAGHGVFRYDMPSDTYEMHWFDSNGGPVRIFRGGFADNRLVLTARAGDSWQRLTYDFNLSGGYRFNLETSEDGQNWKLVIEGENFAGAVTAVTEDSGRTREGARKARVKKASAKKAAAKKAGAKKAGARKTSAKKTATKKTSARKAAARKAPAKKASAKKTSTRKATAKKATARKVSAKKVSAKKAAPRVAAIERQRRQGKASKKISASRKPGAGAKGAPATRTAVSQKKTKSAAHEGPRMPSLKKTSTRVGWHKTAAKGKREN